MDKKEQELYTSPDAKMVEIKVRQIICQSGTSESSGEGDTSGWY